MNVKGRLSVSLVLTSLVWTIFVSVGTTTRLLGKDEGGPYRTEKTECKADTQQTNGCSAGPNTSCPLPLSDSYYYCSICNVAKICSAASGNTCVLFTNKSCGHKKYCESGKDVKDENDNSILRSGAPDICLVEVVEPPNPID